MIQQQALDDACYASWQNANFSRTLNQHLSLTWSDASLAFECDYDDLCGLKKDIK